MDEKIIKNLAKELANKVNSLLGMPPPEEEREELFFEMVILMLMDLLFNQFGFQIETENLWFNPSGMQIYAFLQVKKGLRFYYLSLFYLVQKIIYKKASITSKKLGLLSEQSKGYLLLKLHLWITQSMINYQLSSRKSISYAIV